MHWAAPAERTPAERTHASLLPSLKEEIHSYYCDHLIDSHLIELRNLVTAVRFETGPVEQAEVDYGQLWVWIGARPENSSVVCDTMSVNPLICLNVNARPVRRHRVADR